MDDIAPDLLEKIKNEFQQRMKEDELLKSLKKKLQAGAAAHEDAYEYANRVGEILAEAYRHHISAETLPEGKLWYNIASRVITPTMQTDRSLIAEYVTAVQNSLNQAAGLGIKAVQPEMGLTGLQILSTAYPVRTATLILRGSCRSRSRPTAGKWWTSP